MSVDERIESLDLSAEEYQRENLDGNEGISYVVAKPIPFSQGAKNWFNVQVGSEDGLKASIETQDWIYQPNEAWLYPNEEPKTYVHSTFETKSKRPYEAHVSRSIGAKPSPYQVNGAILGATTWSIDSDSNIATPKDSYIFESGLNAASYQWKAPGNAVRNKFEQSLKRKLTPVTQKVSKESDDSERRKGTTISYEARHQRSPPVRLSGLRIV